MRNKHLNFQAERGHRILRRIKIKNALEQAYNFPLPPLHFDLFSRNTLKEEVFFFSAFQRKNPVSSSAQPFVTRWDCSGEQTCLNSCLRAKRPVGRPVSMKMYVIQKKPGELWAYG